ncbi:DUF4302 domain-containing protein [Pedobacter hiemivivus]|uniref:DUF4302 domain-containing protein n=1 Tax=Pedobacter hiemivivus TaxID=2530454 RepID=A0A4R0MQ70_9SPHI|nr:DUF4302 domain-containing protein [Pedobacter hiemivivus]TCC88988.1 DUF4302 domain-containing protein [Pedobacter hiemivivus]
MKIKILSIFCLALALSSCKKGSEDLMIDGKLPELRSQESLETYGKALTSASNGWAGYLFTEGGGGYGFYMDFNDQDRVNMLAEIDAGTATDIMESTYRLKAVMGPSLIFDTYNYLHLLADPNSDVVGGTAGVGFKSDFEFEFSSLKGDTVKLVGKKRRSDLFLVKLNAEQQDFYLKGGLKTLVSDLTTYFNANKNLYITGNAEVSKVQFSVNMALNVKKAFFTWVENGVVKTAEAPFAYTTNGMFFNKPLVFNNIAFKTITWDKSKNLLTATTTTGKQIDILRGDLPIIPLHILMGTDRFKTITVFSTPFQTWSTSFTAMRATMSTSLTLNTRRLGNINFIFNDEIKQMKITVTTFRSILPTVSEFVYNYTKTVDGTYDFEFVNTEERTAVILNAVLPLTKIFNDHKFTLDYKLDPVQGQVGSITSVDDPNYYLSGELK